MDAAVDQNAQSKITVQDAIRMTAPGTALRMALDMILAGHLGALICIGDTDRVLSAGNDGFPLNISFTANRLFELSKMDGAIVVDGDLNQILRANFHLNPDANLPTAETGMRHRTASRMSSLTDAMIISVSQRRQIINVYLNGKSLTLQSVAAMMTTANQLLATLQTTRNAIDKNLTRLSSLELSGLVTLGDVADIISLFELLMKVDADLSTSIAQLGREGKAVAMQRRALLGRMYSAYDLLIRDYMASDDQTLVGEIRDRLTESNEQFELGPEEIAEVLGYEGMSAENVMNPRGLRTLSRISVVREGMAEKIIEEYGSLQRLIKLLPEDRSGLDRLDIPNPEILVDSLYRMWGRKEM